MSENNFFALTSRMKNINRWALMRNTQTENLSQHSHEVAVIAHALVVISNKRF
ncbi:MAG: YfbR-like 5'-deoxynucleotidase, partial [Oscillospiraceae bacterium]